MPYLRMKERNPKLTRMDMQGDTTLMWIGCLFSLRLMANACAWTSFILAVSYGTLVEIFIYTSVRFITFFSDLVIIA